jgi:hypothetical protein
VTGLHCIGSMKADSVGFWRLNVETVRRTDRQAKLTK